MKNRRPTSAVTGRLIEEGGGGGISKRMILLLVPSNTLLLNPFYPGPSDLKSLYPISSSSSQLITESTPLPRKTSPQRSNRRCHLCEQEFRTKSLLRIHMTTVHGNGNDNVSKSPLTNISTSLRNKSRLFTTISRYNKSIGTKSHYWSNTSSILWPCSRCLFLCKDG